MTGDTTPTSYAPFIRTFAIAIALLLAAMVALNLYVDPLGLTGAERFQTAENTSVRVRKVKLIDKLGKAPDVLILGSSRAMKLDPKDVNDVAGITAFNAAVSGGKPIDAEVLAKYVDRHFGAEHFPHIVYALDVESFRDKPIDPALIQTGELRNELPAIDRVKGAFKAYGPLIELGTTKLSWKLVWRRITGKDDKSSAYAPPLSARGMQLWENVDRSESNLEKRIAKQMATYEGLVYGGADGYRELESAPVDSFERTLQLANDRGDTPTVFLTPFHPSAAKHLKGTGADERRQDVLEYIKDLKDDYEFEFVDLTDVTTFDGDIDDFYDGVHMKVENTRALLGYLQQKGLLGDT